ncbi:MAG: arginine--tRNA ligase [Candidatus Dojkabacteria bacterium]|nr:MAG: arginine--tRNA ligase [Candidatus Dojkabacteria bacterium]
MHPLEIVEKSFTSAVQELFPDSDGIVQVSFPTNEEFGELTTNIAMQLSKAAGKSPRDIASEIITHVESQKASNTDLAKIVDSISIAGPGFINISLTHTALADAAISAVADVPSVEKKRVMIEYGQPNTHKLPHIGHLFSYIVGDSIARTLEDLGHTIRKANYQGDIGPHVAKSMWFWIKKGRPEPETLEQKIRLLQECYQEGSRIYEYDEEAKKEIDALNVAIYNQNPAVLDDWHKTKNWCIDFYKSMEEDLGVSQDRHYFESEVWQRGKEIVQQHIGTLFEKSEGAIVFKGEPYGLHTRVFLTQKETPTYEAKDLGLNTLKYQEWPFDTSIITTASEQNEYFKIVLTALQKVEPKLEGKLVHIGFGMVSLSSGKMSSRTGNILSAIDLISEVEKRVTEILQTRAEMSEEEKKYTAHQVALGAVKYAFLRNNILQNMTFDIAESVSFDGRSGPYIQYTHARICSMLAQKSAAGEEIGQEKMIALLSTSEEKALMRIMYKLPYTLKAAGSQYAPHILAEFTYSLAQAFNNFYNTHKVNTAESEELIASRRWLSKNVVAMLKRCLTLLGITPLEKM